MRIVSADVESWLIRPGLLTPPLVCLTWAERNAPPTDAPPNVQIEYPTRDLTQGIALKEAGLDILTSWLINDDVILLGHNGPYDFGVCVAARPSLLPLVFAKYEKDLVRDTIVRQQLIEIATGELKYYIDAETEEPKKVDHSLAALSWRLLKKFLKKEDTYRLRYSELDGVHLEQWPEEARRYAIDDAVTTLEVYEAQEILAGGPIPNSAEQHRAAWALHLMSIYGVKTQEEMVVKLKASLTAEYAEMMKALLPSGLFNVTPSRTIKSGVRKGQIEPEKISKNMKAIRARVVAAFAARSEEAPTTEGGNIGTDKNALNFSGDPDLKRLAEAGGVAKLLETYVPVLERGTTVPINPRWNVLVETGRTSCSNPNMQNLGRRGGVRECYVPRPGWVYISSDYDTIELKALASVCLALVGHSEMAEVLRRGEDLHLSFAADMLGISYADALARKKAGDNEIGEYRQLAKISNFGLPGGLGASTFVDYAAGMGVTITLEKSKWLKDAWFHRWPEMKDYFDLVARMVDEQNGTIVQLRSNRVRGGCSFCSAANGFFQSLTADGAKEALWRVAKECYITKTSPLYGCRPVLFVHDELILEAPFASWGIERTARAAERLTAAMIEAMSERWIPDIPITSKPVITKRLYKSAEPVKIDGVLVPSKPIKIEEDGKKFTRWIADV